MKKLLFITAAFVGMLFITSCGTADDPVPPTPDSDLYLKILRDYRQILRNFITN